MAPKIRDIFNIAPEKGRPIKRIAVKFIDTHFCLDITYADGAHETHWRGYDVNSKPRTRRPQDHARTHRIHGEKK